MTDASSASEERQKEEDLESRMDTPKANVTDSRTASENELASARDREAAAMRAGYQVGLAEGIVDGYDAAFWRESYRLLSDAVLKHLDAFIRDDDVAEEAIFVEAIEKAGAALSAGLPLAGEKEKESNESTPTSQILEQGKQERT